MAGTHELHGHGHDDHGHGHTHGHGHHHHGPLDYGKAFALGIGLNLAFVAVETGYGLAANSVALLADAGHNLSDVLGLVIAWAAIGLSRMKPTARFTYGFKSSSILAALFNAVFLLLAAGAIALEAINRFGNPRPVAGATVAIVAAIGILVNGATAWLFARGRKGDINIRGAFLHMVADAAVSAGVLVSGFLILWTDLVWIDAVVSLIVVVVIVWSTWSLLRDSLAMSLAAVPPGIDVAVVRQELEALEGVAKVHHIHIWPMSTTETALTAHLVIPGGVTGDAFLDAAAKRLEHRFGITHTTLQVERGEDCPDSTLDCG